MRVCTRCKQEKPLDAFASDNTRPGVKKQSFCKQCKNTYNKVAYQEDPKYRERTWRKQNINITFEEYTKLLNSTNNSCEICNTHEDQLGIKLSVDHDHTTGKIRGLLCSKCNTAISFLQDDPVIIKAALNYITKHQLLG